MNLFEKIVFSYERKIKPGYLLKPTDIVIDIGSGDKPFWRGNVFFDKLSLKNLHRHTDTQTIKSFGQFIDGDITKTKFRDKVFDFSFCAHLLEHVERPDLAIEEIVRISKKGYIEVPNGVIEFISPFHSHLWFILLDGNKLVFIRKSKKIHDALLANSAKYNNLIGKTKEPFIRFYWKNKIDYEVIDNESAKNKYQPPEKTPKTAKNPHALAIGNFLYFYVVKFLRKMYKINENVNLESLLKTSKD